MENSLLFGIKIVFFFFCSTKLLIKYKSFTLQIYHAYVGDIEYLPARIITSSDSFASTLVSIFPNLAAIQLFLRFAKTEQKQLTQKEIRHLIHVIPTCLLSRSNMCPYLQCTNYALSLIYSLNIACK